MLGTQAALTAVGVLVAGLLTASPAGAGDRWVFDTRPDGFPVADAPPAQTLASASATWEADEDEGFVATVELAAEPDMATDATLEVAVGTQFDAAGCAAWTVTVRTWRPTGPATRVGSTVTIRVPGASVPPGDPVCGSVSVVGTDGGVRDRLEEPDGRLVAADEGTGGQARVAAVDGVEVPVGRWARVFVLVRYRGSDASGVRLEVESRDAAVRSAVLRDKLEHGDERWLPVRVKLPDASRARVKLTPDAFVPMGRSGNPVWITLRPRR